MRPYPCGRPVSISIHAPRMGSDSATDAANAAQKAFQSTLPGWGATRRKSPRREPDFYFNPRSPGGERLHLSTPVEIMQIFQSTLPGWGATSATLPDLMMAKISIHAPRVGSDRENGHLRPRYGQNHPFSTLIVSQIVINVLGTVRKSQKHQRTSHYEVIKQPERRK